MQTEILYNVEIRGTDRLCVMRNSGHNPEGGEVETVLVVLILCREGKLAHVEFYEPEDLDRAVARFEELRGA